MASLSESPRMPWASRRKSPTCTEYTLLTGPRPTRPPATPCPFDRRHHLHLLRGDCLGSRPGLAATNASTTRYITTFYEGIARTPKLAFAAAAATTVAAATVAAAADTTTTKVRPLPAVAANIARL
ncbi:hypothetical protein LX32DRAFT_657816 [Colletotrichum zoysiae]|uniref:Uncharacterized protein n=1 Tax=Colletotrichum zoysiae TaxID=1216348 RepID=A0AAD9LY05_9PEZI|nr:hypothetical protein LX32DRAFT_657816 [Colletotrichum zoysiae]